MRRTDFGNYIKPLLRACGLTLLAIFLINCLYTFFPLSKFNTPLRAIELVTQYLDLTSLLAVALLILVLSLADFSASRTGQPSTREPSLPDALLLRARFLVALAAILYFVLIPYILVQSQLLRNIGLRVLDKETATIGKQLKLIRKELATPGIKEAYLPALKQRYAPIVGEKVARAGTIEELRLLVEREGKDLNKNRLAKQSQADKDLVLRMVRSLLSSVLYASFIGYVWYYWPRLTPSTKRNVIGAPCADPEELGF